MDDPSRTVPGEALGSGGDISTTGAQNGPDGIPHGPRDAKPFNKAASVVGLVLVIIGLGLFMVPPIAAQAGSTLLVLIVCTGLGLLLFAAGDEARIFSTGVNLVGASAIALAIFFVWKDASAEREKVVRGIVTVTGVPVRGTVALQDAGPAQRPREARLIMRKAGVTGVRTNLSRGQFLFSYALSPSDYADLRDVDCPKLSIEFEDGRFLERSFSIGNLPISSWDTAFDLLYQLDPSEISYRRDGQVKLLAECSERVRAVKRVSAEEKDVSVQRPEAAVTPETADVRRGDRAPPAASSPPSSSSSTPAVLPRASANGKLVGYALFSRLDATQRGAQSWFTIDGKSDARVPIPGDVVVVSREVKLRPVPYHWDDAEQRHVQGADGPTLAVGRRAIVGGDAIVASDEANGARYLIVPVSSVVDLALPTVDPFRPESADRSILGWAYGGSTETIGGDLSEATFDNLTKPAAIYPAPNDVLVARSTVWLRAGPRRWDPATSTYVNEKALKSIRQGQYVRVSGDTRLARGGLSIWIPIDKIEDSLEQVAQSDP